MSWNLAPADVLQQAEKLGLLKQPRLSSDGEIQTELDLADREVTIRIRFGSRLNLPTIWLEDPEALGLLPHLDREICYQEKEGLILDRRDPGRVLAFAVERAREVLLDGISGSNAEDFSAEFSAIWMRHQDLEMALSLLDPGGQARSVIVLSTSKTSTFVADDETTIRDFFGGRSLRRDRTIRRGLYLPLSDGVTVVPPPPRGAMWSPRDVRDKLLPAMTSSSRNLVSKLQGKRPNSIEYAFFSLPTGHGGESLFGLKFVGPDRHPWVKGAHVRKIVPIGMRRFDRSFLVPRGGGVKSLASRRVLLIGCGSVGGVIAQGLSRSGVGALHLVDPQVLSEENTYRHVLGRSFWRSNKAESLAEFIRDNVPYVAVESFPHPIEQLIDSDKDFLVGYDLVAMALGDATLEMYLNEVLERSPSRPFALHSWVEPLGLGGHCLLTGTSGGGGCFECALTSLDDPQEDRVRDRLSFAEPSQEFRRELDGCGSLHTPYAFGDAMRTATQAVQRGLSALLGREDFNTIESWKGSAQEFRANGFKTSPRFELEEAELIKKQRWIQNPRCLTCSETTS